MVIFLACVCVYVYIINYKVSHGPNDSSPELLQPQLNASGIRNHWTAWTLFCPARISQIQGSSALFCLTVPTQGRTSKSHSKPLVGRSALTPELRLTNVSIVSEGGRLGGYIFFWILFPVSFCFFPFSGPVVLPSFCNDLELRSPISSSMVSAAFSSLDLSPDWNLQHFKAWISHLHGICSRLVYSWFNG